MSCVRTGISSSAQRARQSSNTIATYLPSDALEAAAAAVAACPSHCVEGLCSAAHGLVLALADHVLRVIGQAPQFPEPEPGRRGSGARRAAGEAVIDRSADPPHRPHQPPQLLRVLLAVPRRREEAREQQGERPDRTLQRRRSERCRPGHPRRRLDEAGRRAGGRASAQTGE